MVLDRRHGRAWVCREAASEVTVRTAYRVHGGASARTRDAYIYISGDEVVHTASIMYEPNAYQASQQLDTMESVRERSRAISKLADSGHTVRG